MSTLSGATAGKQEPARPFILLDEERFADSKIDSVPGKRFIEPILIVDRGVCIIGSLPDRLEPFLLIKVFIPGIKPAAFVVGALDDIGKPLIPPADQSLDVTDRRIVIVHPGPFDAGDDHLLEVVELVLRFGGRKLGAPLERRMGLGNEGADVDVHVELRFIPDRPEVIDDLPVFLLSIHERKAHHEIKLRQPPSPALRFLNDFNDLPQGNRFVHRLLPRFFRRLDSESQSAFPHLPELLQDSEAEGVHLQGRKGKGDVPMGVGCIEEVDHRFQLGMIAAGKRGKSDFPVPVFIDELADLLDDRGKFFLAVGFVELAGMAEPAAVGTAAHDFHDAVVLRHLNIGYDKVLKRPFFRKDVIDMPHGGFFTQIP